MGRRSKLGEESNALATTQPPQARVRTDAERRERLVFLRALAVARGGACLSSTFYSKAMRWQCANGHEWEATPYAIIRGHWC